LFLVVLVELPLTDAAPLPARAARDQDEGLRHRGLPMRIRRSGFEPDRTGTSGSKPDLRVGRRGARWPPARVQSPVHCTPSRPGPPPPSAGLRPGGTSERSTGRRSSAMVAATCALAASVVWQ